MEMEPRQPKMCKRMKVKVLFVYVGTIIAEFLEETTVEYCTGSITWDSRLNSRQMLKEAAKDHYQYIKRDLDRLRIACDLTTHAGKFSAVQVSDDKALYIYEHPKHITYSSITFTKLVHLCQQDDICEVTHILDPCGEKICHASYFPYFYADVQCAAMLDKLVTEGIFTAAQRVSLLSDLAKHESAIKRSYCTPTYSEVYAGCYDEDDWTERLHTCLRFNKVVSEFTARLRGDEVKKSWLERLPQEISSKCLLFQGAPDLILSCEPDKSEGMICTNIEIHEDQDRDENQDSDEDKEARIQIAHQMINLKPFKKGTSLFDKVGELVAALLNSLACRVFSKHIKGKEVKPLVAHGLYIHRSVAIFHIKVTLRHHETMLISSTKLVDGVLSPELWCAALKYFLNILKTQ